MKESLKKKIKLCDGASAGREVILNYYIKGYKANLENSAKSLILTSTGDHSSP